MAEFILLKAKVDSDLQYKALISSGPFSKLKD